jgi:hypothetical protein
VRSDLGCALVFAMDDANDIRIGDPNAALPTDGGTGGYCNDYA